MTTNPIDFGQWVAEQLRDLHEQYPGEYKKDQAEKDFLDVIKKGRELAIWSQDEMDRAFAISKVVGYRQRNSKPIICKTGLFEDEDIKLWEHGGIQIGDLFITNLQATREHRVQVENQAETRVQRSILSHETEVMRNAILLPEFDADPDVKITAEALKAARNKGRI